MINIFLLLYFKNHLFQYIIINKCYLNYHLKVVIHLTTIYINHNSGKHFISISITYHCNIHQNMPISFSEIFIYPTNFYFILFYSKGLNEHIRKN